MFYKKYKKIKFGGKFDKMKKILLLVLITAIFYTGCSDKKESAEKIENDEIGVIEDDVRSYSAKIKKSVVNYGDFENFENIEKMVEKSEMDVKVLNEKGSRKVYTEIYDSNSNLQLRAVEIDNKVEVYDAATKKTRVLNRDDEEKNTAEFELEKILFSGNRIAQKINFNKIERAVKATKSKITRGTGDIYNLEEVRGKNKYSVRYNKRNSEVEEVDSVEELEDGKYMSTKTVYDYVEIDGVKLTSNIKTIVEINLTGEYLKELTIEEKIKKQKDELTKNNNVEVIYLGETKPNSDMKELTKEEYPYIETPNQTIIIEEYENIEINNDIDTKIFKMAGGK
jgi:PBP1b-binding outer membrane lipoprotein LpoB